jgi:hypothetical protein
MATKQKTKAEKGEKVAEKQTRKVEIDSNLIPTFWRKYSS